MTQKVCRLLDVSYVYLSQLQGRVGCWGLILYSFGY